MRYAFKKCRFSSAIRNETQHKMENELVNRENNGGDDRTKNKLFSTASWQFHTKRNSFGKYGRDKKEKWL